MKRTNSGITLVELLIVVVIIGILSAIAVPAYRNYVIRATRAEAKTQLMSVAGALERCFTRFNAYDDGAGNCAIVATLEGAGLATANGNYLVTGAVEPTTFVLTAAPQGGQAQDTGCGSLTYDETNTRGRSGSKPVEECWR